ncbi:MAG TPA: hypothetical protein VHE35_06405, partial [Kofleriaceae bacterium]|nr:hypothetical protein [Kofleriaceae bacterium]
MTAGLAAGAERALSLLATALVHGTVLAVVGAVLAATVLRRARPAVVAAMWTVVLLKFVVPFGPGARFSLASLASRARAPQPASLVLVVDPAAARPAAPHRHHDRSAAPLALA